MKHESQDALRSAVDRSERAAPAEILAIRESIATARHGNEELLLAELRMQRERLKRLIRLLSEESRSEGEGDDAASPSGAFRRYCHVRRSRT
jgi:hypothetical protein